MVKFPPSIRKTPIDYSTAPPEFRSKEKRIQFVKYAMEGGYDKLHHYMCVYDASRRKGFLNSSYKVDVPPALRARLDQIWEFCKPEITEYFSNHRSKREDENSKDTIIPLLSFKEKVWIRICNPLAQPGVFWGYLLIPITTSIASAIFQRDYITKMPIVYLFWTIIGIPTASIVRQLEIEKTMKG